MKIKCWRTSKCEHIDIHEVKEILMMSGDAEEDKEMMSMGATPMLNFEKEDGGWLAVPVQFVIEITE